MAFTDKGTGTTDPSSTDNGILGDMSNVGNFLQNAGNQVAQAVNAPQPQTKPTTKPSTTTFGGSGAAGSSTKNPALDAISSWVDTLFEHYLGRPASTTELNTIAGQGWTPDRLRQHLRAQPSYIQGLTMGGYEDLVNASKSEYLKYLGYEPSDADIRDLAQRGIRDQFAVNNYLKNRPDVVALHPGAPIDLTDDQFAHEKNQISAHYQQNLQRDATDAEVRDAYLNRQTAAPAKETDLGTQLSFNQQGAGGLQAKDLLSPTARAMGVPA